MIPVSISKRFRRVYDTLRTTAFKSSLLFTVVFSVVMIFAMQLIYNNAKNEISAQIDSRLLVESVSLKRQLEEKRLSLQALSINVIERLPSENAISYCLVKSRNNNDLETKLFDGNYNSLCTLQNKSGKLRVASRHLYDDYVLITAYDISDELGILKRMRFTIYNAAMVLFILSFFGSLYLSYRLTSVIANIRLTARKIMRGDFSRRIPSDNNNSDELDLLAKDLNQMLEKIEDLIMSQRQVTNNIAHDLRSPLNRLRNRMEVSLLDKKTDEEKLRNVIADSILDAENLLKTFNALLSIAQVESRSRNDFQATGISEICEDLAELYEVLAEDGEHQFVSDIEDSLSVKGNKHLLAQAITNLLDNAVKYTDSGGLILLQAWRKNNEVIIAVSDNGKGIPADKFQEVLKRFVRLDSSRSAPGNGLGLSLVQAIVDLHEGKLSLHDNQPGLRVEIHLPFLEK